MGYFKLVTGVMGCGKSTRLISDYRSLDYRGCKIITMKSTIDTRDDGAIKSRNINESLTVDVLLGYNDPIPYMEIMLGDAQQILVDEAHFLSEDQIKQLYYITATSNINVTLYGLKMSWRGIPFRSIQLALGYAEMVDEIECYNVHNQKLTHQIALKNGIPLDIDSGEGEFIIGDVKNGDDESNQDQEQVKDVYSFLTVTKEEFYKIYRDFGITGDKLAKVE